MRYIFFICLGFIIITVNAFYLKIQIMEDGSDAKIEHLELKIKLNRQEIKKLEKTIFELSNVVVKATRYNAVHAQTDSDPNVSACMTKPTVGSVAVSQDLYFKGWSCGKKVHIKGLGIFTIKDVMHYRKMKQIDILTETEEQALEFGIVNNLNAVLLSHYEKM